MTVEIWSLRSMALLKVDFGSRSQSRVHNFYSTFGKKSTLLDFKSGKSDLDSTPPWRSTPSPSPSYNPLNWNFILNRCTTVSFCTGVRQSRRPHRSEVEFRQTHGGHLKRIPIRLLHSPLQRRINEYDCAEPASGRLTVRIWRQSMEGAVNQKHRCNKSRTHCGPRFIHIHYHDQYNR